jgi:carbamoyltransferase
VRSEVPAVTHVDYSARVQTVHQQTNPRYHALISRFYEKTGCPVIVNTSFNVRGEPIVESPVDAFRCFMGTELDVLVVENCYLEKAEQTVERSRYEGAFALD